MNKSDRKRLGLDNLQVGERYHWNKTDYPTHSAKTKQYKMTCMACGYHPPHKLYVCPKCGNCQHCGGVNTIGLIDQSCIYCGNGESVKPIEQPVFASGHHTEQPHKLLREDFEVKAHKKRQSSSSINISNIQV